MTTGGASVRRSDRRGPEGRRVEVEEVFLAALDQPKSEWSAFVSLACGDDAALRQSVFSLLRAHQQTGPLDRLGEKLPAVWAELAGGGAVTGASGPAAAPPRFAPGATLGRYQIRQRLGAGGMGEVYRAFDPRLQREVAIKVIARRIEDHPDALRRFEEEARAASSLNHPNIVTVHDISEQEAFPYIVMELVDGESLRSQIDEPHPLERIVRLGSQLAGALAAAHERGVVHRDLKPENVVLTPQGVAKILDFGVAQFQPVGVDLPTLPTLPRQVVGTVGYMAPEALTGRPTDHRSDQFALGAILYEMATGRPCFRRSSTAATIMSTLREEPEPLSACRAELPAPLVHLVERCLAKEPGDRYASTWQLHKTLSTLPVGPSPRSRRPTAPLPTPPNRLIGRRDELNQIQNLILEARVRLLTVTGAGGCGKTRLAIEAARQLEPSFPGGIFFVSLAALTEPELVGPAIARAFDGMEAARGRELPALLVELAVQGGRLLLVLDNFEQVVHAASLLSTLLAGCPELTILVTSRQVLRLQAEHDFSLQPLAVPPADELLPVEELGRSPAVALFVERARAADPTFTLTPGNAGAVAELCARLDGLPLALELAAVRVRTLTPAAMLERLGRRFKLLTGGPRDLPERQRTLRQAIDWSHELLDPAEQLVFQRLAVFAGGFSSEAAQAVADPFGHLERDVEDIVGSLLDKSLLVRSAETSEEPRFALLDTVREYAVERLAARQDEAEVRKAHAAYFLVLAQEGSVAEGGRAGAQRMQRFIQERHNFRAALDWLVASDNAAWGLQIAEGLYPLWFRGEDISEAARKLGQLLALPSAGTLAAARAKGLYFASGLAFAQGKLETALALGQQALESYRQLGDRRGQGAALNSMGVFLTDHGRTAEARGYYEELLDLWRELGDDVGYGRTLSNCAFVLRQEGELERARELYQQAAAMFERLGDRLGAAWEASHEGDVALQQGDSAAAAALHERALAAFRELEEPWGVGAALADLGDVARTQGALERADELYREGLKTCAPLGHRRGVARAIESLAVAAAGRGRPERTLLLAAAAAAERKRIGGRPHGELKDALASAVERARAQLDTETASAAWRRGSRMSLDQAVRTAAEA